MSLHCHWAARDKDLAFVRELASSLYEEEEKNALTRTHTHPLPC